MAQIKYKDKLNGFPIPTELALVAITTLIFYFYDADVKVFILAYLNLLLLKDSLSCIEHF